MREVLGGCTVACHRHGVAKEHLPDVKSEFFVGVKPFDERPHAGTECVGVKIATGVAVKLNVGQMRPDAVKSAHRF